MSDELFLQSWETYTEVKSAGFLFIMQDLLLVLLMNFSPRSAKS